MALTIHPLPEERPSVRRLDDSGAVVLSVGGPVTSRTLADVCDVLDELSDSSVIVDLSDVSFSDVALVGELVSILQLGHREDDCCVVVRQPSSRSTLRRASGLRLAMFQTVADATQAQLLARYGYGPGWGSNVATNRD